MMKVKGKLEGLIKVRHIKQRPDNLRGIMMAIDSSLAQSRARVGEDVLVRVSHI